MGNKAIILVMALLLGFSSFSGYTPAIANANAAQPQTAKVLICNSSSSYAYHSYTCSGLKRCTHSVLSITKADAVSRGRTACKICYK